jgi:hypothetical protein
LKPAIDRRDFVTTGFWPASAVMSATACSMTLRSEVASPTPMLSVILVIFGTAIALQPSFFCSSGATVF